MVEVECPFLVEVVQVMVVLVGTNIHQNPNPHREAISQVLNKSIHEMYMYTYMHLLFAVCIL